MRTAFIILILAFFLFGCQPKQQMEITTFCNPIDLSYRFCLDEPSRREAADPTIVWFRDRYFLLASKSGGYWHSQNLTDWKFVETNEIPVEEYAPTAIEVNDTLYFLASSTEQSNIYKSVDPLSGHWSMAREKLDTPVWDPAFFLDEDNRLYLYWGCSNANPLYGVELDFNKNFSFIGKPVELKFPNPEQLGWEVPGDYNTLYQSPWIEGAWMNKYNNKYYLQYAGPGTEFKSYSDGVYVSDNPLGSFELQQHNPFAYKPEGFAAGAGHGSTFTDQYGNYWHIGTITISQKHNFERRLGLYPALFDEQGTMYSMTKYGDYPMIMPQKKISRFEDIFPGWMLLSYRKKVEVSSSADSLPSINMTDEDIRTYWAAQSGNSGEYATIDLGETYNVYAIQLNFAEHNTNIYGREKGHHHRYTVECSKDRSSWAMLIDQSQNETDNTHVYFQLSEKMNCRYLKLTNIEVPGGSFALSGFRVFGLGDAEKPGVVSSIQAKRNQEDRRSVTLSWNKAKKANGYNISYGADISKLYLNYMVYSDTTVTINSLNAGMDYYFTIEAFNENGITKGDIIVKDK